MAELSFSDEVQKAFAEQQSAPPPVDPAIAAIPPIEEGGVVQEIPPEVLAQLQVEAEQRAQAAAAAQVQQPSDVVPSGPLVRPTPFVPPVQPAPFVPPVQLAPPVPVFPSVVNSAPDAPVWAPGFGEEPTTFKALTARDGTVFFWDEILAKSAGPDLSPCLVSRRGGEFAVLAVLPR